MKYLKYIILAFALPALPYSLIAQRVEPNTPAAYEVMKNKSQWMQTSNAGGLLLDTPLDYTELSLSYDTYTGNYHRSQEGTKGNDLNILVEGATFIKKLYVWGKFDYTRSTVKDANFNASLIDPFRGMPYMVADTNRSEWRNQVYDMTFKMATPKRLGEKVSFGLEGKYKAMSGGKQRDIRSENYFFIASIKPALVYSINEEHHIGANFEYYKIMEESNNSNENMEIDQQFYELYGLGNATSRIGSGRTTNYEGDNVGGGLNYNYQGYVNLLLSSTYNYKAENVQASFTKPRDIGSVKDKIWSTKLLLYKDIRNLTHYITIDYTNRNIDGIESITQYDNSTSQDGYVTLARFVKSEYKTQSALLDYDFTINKGNEYLWKLGAGIRYINQEDVYFLPHSEKTSENMIFQIRAKKNFILNNDKLNKRILVAADCSYKHNFSGKYEYNGVHPEYPVVTQLEDMDNNYLNNEYIAAGISATYSQKIKEGKPANLFVKGKFNYTKANGDLFDNRNYLAISLGCNF